MVQLLFKNGLTVPKMIKHKSYHMTEQSRHITKKNKTYGNTKILNMNVYSSIIHNSQSAKGGNSSKHPSTDKVDKHSVVYLCKGVLLSYKKERHLGACYNMVNVR